MRVKQIAKIAGFTMAGFVAASVAADRVPLSPAMSQIAGFAGAFLGTLVGQRRRTPAKVEDPKPEPAGTSLERRP